MQKQGGKQDVFKPLSSLSDVVAHRTELLTKYQNKAWAERYRRLVNQVMQAEASVMPGSEALAVAVARNFAKLMSYKDEYEVARLHTSPEFLARLRETFEDGANFRYNLAPPLFSKRDPVTGNLVKREFGPWVLTVFKVLAKMKGLRGTVMDVFGYTSERKMERRLIDAYEEEIGRLIAGLNRDNHRVAVAIAELPAQIRGYGHVKEANVEKVAGLLKPLREQFENPSIQPSAKKKVIPVRVAATVEERATL